MKFLSVCSGIEAASVAWEPLGWEASGFAEIEPFPCAVLAHHYPDVPNHGDMSLLPSKIRKGEVEAPDLLCGGTPCQAFSVAGLRQSLDDARGNLTLTFCEIADAIDSKREQSCIVFWENVPGVLNTKDNAFGCFLGALAGEDDALIAPGGRWANAGFIDGPQRAVAWRVLDAQYFGVAQRRRRVFVIASARADFDPAAVLFEFQGVRRDTAPSREKREGVASSTRTGAQGCSHWDGDFPHPTLNQSSNCGGVGSSNQEIFSQRGAYLAPVKQWPAEISSTLDTTFGTKQGLEDQHVNAGCPMFVPAQPIALAENTIGRQPQNGGNGDGFTEGGPMYTLNATGVHGVAQPVAYAFDSLSSNSMKSTNPLSGCNKVNLSKTLDTSRGLDPSCNQGGIGVAQPVGFTRCDHGGDAVIDGTPTMRCGSNYSAHLAAVIPNMAVRRLTPVECERLQGFPDNYTNIPWRKQPTAPDGPRYKALGNSWAVPVVKWIGERIERSLA
jgi:DNA (cytosine-5)-methyltransferase 1